MDLQNLEHPDVTSAQKWGYPTWMNPMYRDPAELRETFIDTHLDLLANWLRKHYPDLLVDFYEDVVELV